MTSKLMMMMMMTMMMVIMISISTVAGITHWHNLTLECKPLHYFILAYVFSVPLKLVRIPIYTAQISYIHGAFKTPRSGNCT